MNTLLLRDGFPPSTIGPQERVAYLNVINDRQKTEPLRHGIIHQPSRSGYLLFMAGRLLTSLSRYIRILEFERRGPDEKEAIQTTAKSIKKNDGKDGI